MAVFFNTVRRINPANPDADRKWFPVIKSVKQVGGKEVAKLMATETTLNHKEAEMAMSQFGKAMRHLLLDGYTVQLEEWGSFRLTCNGEGNHNREEVSAQNIKTLNVRFSPSKELKEDIQRAELRSVESMLSKQ